MQRNEYIEAANGLRGRANEVEKQALRAVAAFEAVNLSEALRLLIREGAQRRNLWPPKMEVSQ